MQLKVREYASQMGSMRHLLSDLTLPVLSVFNGRGFDSAMQVGHSADWGLHGGQLRFCIF